MGNNLINKSCVPCKGDVPPLDSKALSNFLKDLGGGWVINELGHLFKEYKFKDFISSMTFANKIAEIAEKEYHHPDILISWGKCVVEIWTHKIHGLTESDFILAAKIDSLI